MEFELVEKPREEETDGDSPLIRDHSALKNQSSVSPEDYPERHDQALEIPEEEKD